MTAPEYVAQAAELLTEHGLDVRLPSGDEVCLCGACVADQATHQAEVLAAAGLIPTTVEWGVATPCVPTCPTAPHVSSEDFGGCESTARELVADVERATLVSRPAHDWKDATDD